MDGVKGRQRAGGAGMQPIGQASVRTGAAYAQADARRMLDAALSLHRKGRFRGAIRLAILSIEEALKGTRLGIAAMEREDMTRREWALLRSHRHKLTNIPDWIVKKAEAGCEPGAREHVAEDRGRIADGARRAKSLVKNLQGIKEACVYEEWDAAGGRWGAWSLDGEETEALALCVLGLAGVHCEMCRAGIGAALGAFGAGQGKEQRGEAILARLGAEIGAKAAVEDEDAGSE